MSETREKLRTNQKNQRSIVSEGLNRTSWESTKREVLLLTSASAYVIFHYRLGDNIALARVLQSVDDEESTGITVGIADRRNAIKHRKRGRQG